MSEDESDSRKKARKEHEDSLLRFVFGSKKDTNEYLIVSGNEKRLERARRVLQRFEAKPPELRTKDEEQQILWTRELVKEGERQQHRKKLRADFQRLIVDQRIVDGDPDATTAAFVELARLEETPYEAREDEHQQRIETLKALLTTVVDGPTQG